MIAPSSKTQSNIEPKRLWSTEDVELKVICKKVYSLRVLQKYSYLWKSSSFAKSTNLQCTSQGFYVKKKDFQIFSFIIDLRNTYIKITACVFSFTDSVFNREIKTVIFFVKWDSYSAKLSAGLWDYD